MTQTTKEPALELRGVSKAFNGRLVLDDFSLVLEPGEIHGLIGQNGSGKSTLIKILSGFHQPEPGASISVCGSDKLVGEAANHSSLVRVVHQDLALHDGASVLENFCIGSFATQKGVPLIDWDACVDRVRSALARFAPGIEVDTLVGSLDATDKAFVAIARAIDGLSSETGGLLILDEPTAYLPKDGVAKLFATLRTIADSGIAVLFVSHDLGEVLDLTHRVTILRDGVIRFSGVTDGLEQRLLVHHIVGRALEEAAPRAAEAAHNERGDVLLQLHDIETDTSFVSDFSIRAGEIVGFTGLLGSGFSRTLYAVFGAYPAIRSGSFDYDGQTFQCRDVSPAEMTGRGIAFIPSDRARASTAQRLTVAENLTVLLLNRFRRFRLLSHRRELAQSHDLLEKYGVRPADPRLALDALSGGNQQKVVLGKWVETNPRVLMLHEPTQGVDVGARQEIYEQIKSVAANGSAVIVASANYEELPLLCDRVVIFRKGHAVAELSGTFDQGEITQQCFAT